MKNLDRNHATLSVQQVRFVATFLRFEFALKESGFLPEKGNASVDWAAVAGELGDGFFQFVDASGEAGTTMRSPAKTQISHNRQLVWRDEKPPTNTHQLLEAVRRVRNNVLHGGKSGDPEGARPRSERLIADAQWIVEQAILRMDPVRAHFEGWY